MKNLIPLLLILPLAISVQAQKLKRAVFPKIVQKDIPSFVNSERIVFKIHETDETDKPAYSLYDDTPLFSAIESALSGIEYNIQPLFTLPVERLLKMRDKAESMSGNDLANLSLYYRIDLYNCAEQQRLAALNGILFLDKIETAYFPLKVSAEEKSSAGPGVSLRASPDFTAGQVYLNPAPAGIDAAYAWGFSGGKGLDIRFCDVEIDVYEAHEELLTPPITDVSMISGNFFGNQHGTATMSEVLADHDGSGVDGIAPDAVPYFSTICADINCSTYTQANGIVLASDTLRPGDVMLIELQTISPYPFGLPQEYDQASFDAIQIATSLGIAVVEAAGNGSNNLDSSYFNSTFDTSFRYSGAFIIGAANADSSVMGATWPPRGKAWFSSYGSRVDFFGWGEMVTTAGYGDLYGSSLVDNYTASFNGTSSASPIVAGAVVAMRGIYKAVTNGNVFPLPMLRDILKATGTPSFDPPNDKIGVMPNLKAAVDTLMIILSTEKQLKKQQFLEVMAYPNPVQDALAVDCYFNRGHISVELFNAMGQLCFRQDIKGHNRKYNTTIDFGGLRSGMYLLRVSDGNHSVVTNIIKE